MKKRIMLMAAAVAILLIGIIVSLFWTGRGGVQGKIILPGSGDGISGVDVEIVEQNIGKVEQVAVDRDNALRGIASLQRPAEYTYAADVTYFYPGGSTVVHLTGAVSDSYCKAAQTTPNGTLKHTLITPDSIYIWSSASVALYKGAKGETTGDDLLLMPTYEELLAPDGGKVTEAQYHADGSPANITVSFERGDKRMVYTLSVETGLLIAAEEFEGETRLYRAELTSVSCEKPDASYFRLPNGTQVKE